MEWLQELGKWWYQIVASIKLIGMLNWQLFLRRIGLDKSDELILIPSIFTLFKIFKLWCS